MAKRGERRESEASHEGSMPLASGIDPSWRAWEGERQRKYIELSTCQSLDNSIKKPMQANRLASAFIGIILKFGDKQSASCGMKQFKNRIDRRTNLAVQYPVNG